MTAHGIGFDNEKYLKEQTSFILERAGSFGNKLYLEFGGKLVFDYHAARILPGFDPNVKMKLLQRLKDKADIILCIYAGDIERKKIRADFGITYDADAMKLIDDLRSWSLDVLAVVVTRYEGQPVVKQFVNRLKNRQVRVYTHGSIEGYPTNVDEIVSERGYGSNEHIETKKPIVVVTAPGPGSGKLATCMSQMYHDHKRGVKSGYAKFETFPIWNLPLAHPVNVAYEAATADLGDFNEVDTFYQEAHGGMAVNYNRDMEIFPVVKKILGKIMGTDLVYKSPTDMGVNRAGFAIVDDQVVREAALQEIIRRYFRYRCEYAVGLAERRTTERAEQIMKSVGVKPDDRTTVLPARTAAEEAAKKNKGNEGIFCGAAVETKDGAIVTGNNSPLMHAASSVVLNAIKSLAGIPDRLHLLSPAVIDSIAKMKHDILHMNKPSLNLDETLIALSISATTNPTAQMAMEKLTELRGCEMHMTHMPPPGDEVGLRKLGVNLTSEPNYSSRNLFVA